MEHAGRVMHASVRIGDAVLEMGEPESRKGIPAGGFFVRVDDVETAYAKALAAGGMWFVRRRTFPTGPVRDLRRTPRDSCGGWQSC